MCDLLAVRRRRRTAGRVQWNESELTRYVQEGMVNGCVV